MAAKVLFLIVEGDDDERFMENVVKPILLKSYADVKIWQYAQQKHERTVNLINSARKIGDYLYFHDFDNAPCITARRNELVETLRGIEKKKIIVVRNEIESWYLAGLDRQSHRELRIGRYHADTDGVSKEQFNGLIPKKMRRVEFMSLVVRKYNIGYGRRKNRSFEHFMRKHLDVL
jgi:hypothetical protein